ncbi:MAG TPA: FkbM family methyltransferase [Cyclobacteriaceae bacterium]|nr:FkbM family methyltransferase [Cyclobacteriaceae bacterium]
MNRTCVDKDGQPIPWVTYSFIDFFVGKKISDFSILEFGSGNSTLFWHKCTNQIFSIEHDRDWFNKVKNLLPSQYKEQLLFLQLGTGTDHDYTKAATHLKRKFDIIFVDGRERVKCAIDSRPWLSEKGVLVLDDSERERYADAVSFYLSQGFKKLDFWGIAPGIFNNKCTSIFYRPNNILDI